MKPTKVDRLFALKAVEQRVSEERKLLEGECRQELLEAYAEDGTDRRASQLFGPEAGKFGLRRQKGTPARSEASFRLEDEGAFGEWLEDNLRAALGFAMLNAADVARWWLESTGELPDGTSREVSEVPACPGAVTAQVYSFKPEVVLARLAEGGGLLEGADRFLEGGGDD